MFIKLSECTSLFLLRDEPIKTNKIINQKISRKYALCLIWLQRGQRMKFKNIVPYMIFGSVLLGSSAVPAPDQSQTQSNDAFLPPIPPKTVIRYNTEQNKTKDSLYLDNKADSLCDTYIKNMLVAQQKLKPWVPSLLSQATSLNLRFCDSKRETHSMTSGGNEVGEKSTWMPDTAGRCCEV